MKILIQYQKEKDSKFEFCQGGNNVWRVVVNIWGQEEPRTGNSNKNNMRALQGQYNIGCNLKYYQSSFYL